MAASAPRRRGAANDLLEMRGPGGISATPRSSARHARHRGAAPGAFANPEDLAFARPAAELAVRQAAFEQLAVWQEGSAGDELLVEIYEPWLEPA